MSKLVIQNLVLNSPLREASRHFRFDEEGITDTVIEGRRESEYLMRLDIPEAAPVLVAQVSSTFEGAKNATPQCSGSANR